MSSNTAASLVLTSFTSAWAHSGGLDQYGCHHDTATGGYHCHDEEDDIDWALLLAVLGGVIVLGVVVAYISRDDQQYNLKERLEDDSSLGFRIVPLVNAPEGDGVDLEFEPSTGTKFGIRATTDQLPLDNPDRNHEGDYIGAFYRLKF